MQTLADQHTLPPTGGQQERAGYCVFLKCYVPGDEQDQFLIERVALLLEHPPPEARELAGFFFIRYRDPKPHLRLRWFGPKRSMANAREALKRRLSLPVARKGKPIRVVEASYRRETKRYGGPAGMHLAEDVFHLDSLFSLDALRLKAHDPATLTKAEMALLSAELMLMGLGFPWQVRNHVFGSLVDLPEATKRVPRQALEKHYKNHQEHFRKIARDPIRLATDLPDPWGHVFKRVFDESQRVRQRFDQLQHSLTRSGSALAQTYVHMHFNRFGFSRLQESILYWMRLRALETPS